MWHVKRIQTTGHDDNGTMYVLFMLCVCVYVYLHNKDKKKKKEKDGLMPSYSRVVVDRLTLAQ